GERAFRYCQHDVGHATAALAFAARTVDWPLHLLYGADDNAIAALLGLFSDVYENAKANLKLPATTGSFPIQEFAGKAVVKLLTNRDGSTYLAKYKVEKGNQYLCFAPLDQQYNDLVNSAEVFIPMLYKMSISTTKASKIAYTLDKDAYIESDMNTADKSDKVFRLENDKTSIIPEQKTIQSHLVMHVNNLIKEAGFYTLVDDNKKKLQDFAFNFNRKESDLLCLTKDEIKAAVSGNVKLLDINQDTNLSTMVGEKELGIILWKWFVVLALIFLALESLIIRFWKV
ncbi:MAG TPA: hypothetical protein PKD14_05785, partial [Saprospiraceae bacterium]|nr:hypothetical protein [Saprospiraceae bacterium]